MFRILTDSTSSIPVALRDELGIDTVSLHVHHGAESHEESTMDLDAFYANIADMADDIPTSSQPSPALLEEYFERAAAEGQSVLGVFISSKMSGTFNAVVAAAARIKERYSNFHYALVDSLTNCLELGWPVIDAAEARRAGGSFEACTRIAREALNATRFVFAPENLTFLEKGGRIGHASALLGNLLKISPVLTCQDGFASVIGKVRTQERAKQEMIKTFTHDIRACGLKHVVVHYIGDRAPAEVWAREAVEPLAEREVRVVPASPVIGVHVGPAVGICYECLHAIPGKHAEPGPECVMA